MAEPRLGILERLQKGLALSEGGYVLERRGDRRPGPTCPVAIERLVLSGSCTRISAGRGRVLGDRLRSRGYTAGRAPHLHSHRSDQFKANLLVRAESITRGLLITLGQHLAIKKTTIFAAHLAKQHSSHLPGTENKQLWRTQ